MKIAVVGCGALGSYYGAMLLRANEDVSFLLRTDYEIVRRRGLQIRSKNGDFHVNPKCARDPNDIGICDLVMIGLKTTANHQFPKLLPPLVGPYTTLLTLQNGLGNEAELAKYFPAEQIMGGLCFVCLNRIEPGLVHHLEHGKIVLGEYQRWPEPRTHEIAAMIRNSGVPCKVTENLEAAHWEKLVWNIPFNGLGVAAAAGYDAMTMDAKSTNIVPDVESPLQQCMPTDALLSDPKWELLVRDLMLEIIEASSKIGYPLEPKLAEIQIERTRSMGAYKASTLLDFEKGLPLELESLFLEPLRQAQSAGASTPILSRLCKILQKLSAT